MSEGITPRRALDDERRLIEVELLDMVNKSVAMFNLAVRSLHQLDTGMARQALGLDDEIDRLDLEIESKCLDILALQQPMGSDLREVGTCLKIITDIERVGDLSVDISKITLKIDKELGRSDFVDLPRLAVVVTRMLNESAQMFARKSADGLDQIGKLEDEVDEMYREFRTQTQEFMVAHPEQVVAASWMLLALHHIERVADHALNMAERVHFMVTGELRQIVPDDPDRG
ncbi:MAG: phosphate signaling complex protein PhoU [Armatimonadetes bacterium]|nr:phosphate signaling complex protein PhoU [Armatimonadota bacterium]MBS1711585.1 phosphate signaling complex protein PhoU [Armatimonadota bacterium]MBX3109860.1 phosphate signaling complex protein PhoU [Fimbriimonadaceae bacterium]